MRGVNCIVTLCMLLYSSVHAVSPKDIVHAGCFTTSLVKSNRYYEVHYMLTWEECIKFCDHRLTRYVGIQAEHKQSADNFCYCGNDLVKHSTPADNSSCRYCIDNNDKYCGGNNTVSLYRIRDSTPFSVLMAHYGNNRVMMYTGDNSTVKLITIMSDPRVVDYVYIEDEIFSLSGNSFYRSFFNHILMSYDSPLYLDNGNVYDFAVDWTSYNKTYWASKGYTIYETSLRDSHTQILSRSNEVTSLSVDPYLGYLFFVEGQNRLNSYSIKNKTVHMYHNGKFHMRTIKKMAIAHHLQLIYAIGTLNEKNTPFLVSVDYEDTKMRVLFSGPQINDIRALDAFKDEVAWVNYNDGLYSLYRCKLTPRCQTENLAMLYQSTYSIIDIRIYHPEKQTPSIKYLCSVQDCSHGCEIVSLFVVKCTCPPDMTIGQDNVTCEGKNPAILPRTTQEQTPLLEDILKYDAHTDNKTESEMMPPTGENEGTDNDKQSSVPIFELFVGGCLLVILILLAALFYLCLRSTRQNGNISLRFQKSNPEEIANDYIKNSNIAHNNSVK